MDTLADTDVAAVALIGIGAVLGLCKGAVRLLVGLLALVAGFLLSARHGPTLLRLEDLPALAEADWVASLPPGDVALLLAAAGRTLVFAGVLLAGVVVGRVLRRVVQGTSLAGYDRLVGAVVGGARGGLVAAVLLVALLSVPHDGAAGRWGALRTDLGASRTRAFTIELVGAGRALMPEGVSTWLDGVLEDEDLPEPAALRPS